jgi:hypothetical protein
MAWEKRGNNRYYYRKRREGKRIISEYVGRGDVAQLISAIDLDERMEHQYKKEQLKKYKSDVHQLNRNVDQVSMAINGFLRATLLISGFHPHKGQWRKIRDE